MNLKYIPLFILLLNIVFASAQNHYERFNSVDVLHYSFEIHLNDSTNIIDGKTTITAKFLNPVQIFVLDFVGKNDSTNTGMQVSAVNSHGKTVRFSHENNQLRINFNSTVSADTIIELMINYSGIPADGLIISKNKFGDRTFFGDNWPDRARYWLPVIDHPSDKATVDFRIFAPEKYQVVSIGFQMEETNLEHGMKYTCWKENVPISTKIMVIGVARFAVRDNENNSGIPVSSWVFPQNSEEGFRDYAVGNNALNYFTEIIGPYSYEKLAHVQSNTRYGGMENAGCIFYAEKSVTGNKQVESLIAHETAHQWFGNSVTEQNWHHIWLSEGFATYLTHLYNEHFWGKEYFDQQLERDRDRVIRFAYRKMAPVIDTSITNYNQLLNTNSYQKASWFLHMLREKIGDTFFVSSLQEYYRIFKDSTAVTFDFQSVVEKVSGHKLDTFFYQWLYQPGFPQIKTSWEQKKDNTVVLKIDQVQENNVFDFPLEIEVILKNRDKIFQTVEIEDRETIINIQLNEKAETIRLDPALKLLFEEIR